MDTNRTFISIDNILETLHSEADNLKKEIQLQKAYLKSKEYELMKKHAFRMFFAFLNAFEEGKPAVLFLPAQAEIDQMMCRLLIENDLPDQIASELKTYIDSISAKDRVDKLRQETKKNTTARPISAPYYNCTSWYLLDKKKTINCEVVISSPRRVFLSSGCLFYVNID